MEIEIFVGAVVVFLINLWAMYAIVKAAIKSASIEQIDLMKKQIRVMAKQLERSGMSEQEVWQTIHTEMKPQYES